MRSKVLNSEFVLLSGTFGSLKSLHIVSLELNTTMYSHYI